MTGRLFFYTWELKGRFPKILEDPKMGKEASKLYQDANSLIKEIIEIIIFTPKRLQDFFRRTVRVMT